MRKVHCAYRERRQSDGPLARSGPRESVLRSGTSGEAARLETSEIGKAAHSESAEVRTSRRPGPGISAGLGQAIAYIDDEMTSGKASLKNVRLSAE